MRPLGYVFLGILSLATLTGCRGNPQVRGLATPKRAIWFWHTPFSLSRSEAQQLDELKIDQVFVRAGTFSFDGDRITPTLRQRWESKVTQSVHAVYNFDAGALKHFEELNDRGLVSTIADTFRADQASAARSGVKLSGIQLDIDCPTRLLPKYARLTAGLRGSLPKSVSLSITGLTSWLVSSDLASVIEPLDFLVPQFYEASTPKNIDDPIPLANSAALATGMDICRQLGKPFYVGTPIYGQTLLYDDKSRLVGTYRGLSPEDAIRLPALEFVRGDRVNGEDRLVFRAIKPGQSGKGLGYRLLYRIPTEDTVKGYWDAVRAEAPDNCLGLALFRMPEGEESMVLPLSAVTAVLEGRNPTAMGSVLVKSEVRPWSAIEGGAASEVDLTFTLKNEGDAATAFGPDAVEAVLFTTTGTIHEARTESGLVDPFSGDPNSSKLVSLARADGLRFRRARLGPGATVRFGPVTLAAEAAWRLEWRLKTSDGSTVRGKLESPKNSSPQSAR